MGDPATTWWAKVDRHDDHDGDDDHFHSYLVLKSGLCHVRFEERQNTTNVEQGTFSLEHGTCNEFFLVKKGISTHFICLLNTRNYIDLRFFVRLLLWNFGKQYLLKLLISHKIEESIFQFPVASIIFKLNMMERRRRNSIFLPFRTYWSLICKL